MFEINTNWPKYGFSVLLFLLVAFLLINPILLTTVAGNIILQLLITSILISILYLLRRNKEILYCIIPLILLALVLGWYNFFHYSHPRQIAVYLLKVAILGLSIITIARFVAKHKVIDTNIIAGALSLYILMAMMWALIYTIVELHIPHSFSGTLLNPEDTSPLDRANSIFTNMVYFSFTTITTLGLGDIAPINIYSRAVVVIETLFGVFYFGALISTLIAIRYEQVQNNTKGN